MKDAVKLKKNKHSVIKNISLLLLVVIITALPIFLHKDAEFNGTDSEAEKAITEIKTDYEPWFKPIFEPPSGEVESMLFALQAALGAGFIGYYIGYVRGCKRKVENK